MTLPTSGPISMSMVAAELGISAVGLSLGDSRVRALAGKPSGAISFTDLRGKSAASPVSGYGGSVLVSRLGGSCGAKATFNPDGSVVGGTTGAGTITSNGLAGDAWFSPLTASIGNSYYIKATVTAGSVAGDTVGAWVLIGTGKSWNAFRSSPGSATGTITVQIASDAAGANVVASGSISLSATWET